MSSTPETAEENAPEFLVENADTPPEAAPESEESNSDILRMVASQPCRVHDITVEGNNRTKEAIILRHFEAARKAETFEQIQLAIQDAADSLTQLGIFETVVVKCDVGPAELPSTTNICVKVKEKNGLSLSIGTFFQGWERTVESNVTFKNWLGYAETLECHMALGLEMSNRFGVDLHILLARLSRLQLRFVQDTSSRMRYSSFNTTTRSVTAAMARGNHEGAIELSWQQNWFKPEGKQAPSGPVLRALGHSLKAGIKHTWSLNRLDSVKRPTSGWAVSVVSELANMGLGLDFATIFRQELCGRAAIPLGFANAAILMTVTSGWLCPLNSISQTSRINNCFFLGGSSSIRGFHTSGIGPSAPRANATPGRDALGGDIMLSATAAVAFDLPLRGLREWGAHGQVFMDSGSVVPWPSVPRAFVQDLMASVRCSVGAGIVFPTNVGNFELNFCRVLRSQEHDRPLKHGIQLGIRS